MVGVNVERVGEVGGRAIRRVIQRVAIRVGDSQGERSRRLAESGLQRVVLGVGNILDRDNVAETQVRANLINAEAQLLGRKSRFAKPKLPVQGNEQI